METFFKEKLSEARSALRQKEEELKTVIDRLASEDVVSTNENYPDGMKYSVTKSRLTGFYHQLKLLRWPQIKDHLKSNNITPKFITVLIQKMFKAATDEMEKKKEQIEVFGLTETGSGQTPQKVKEQKQLAIHNLQMSVYHSSKEDLLKTLLCEYEAHYSEDVMVQLRLLASECYWLGCLLALNNPPLQLDWQNHIPGMDGWDIFPRDMKTSVN
ncbi:uncharacterized protein LOC115778002 [Archocentrus centrarchus]|uniref:uncharacterized protein LOC115778002 n=1 Tax=Archocentrus centrarchus TaxID=63155 RepID=UPI0011EA21DE|nr:uncharacterized protein LOC115778002 [Archocentrus centrarchus]